MLIEFHDTNLANEEHGSLAAHAGQNGTINCTFEAEELVQQIFGEPTQSEMRGYLFDDNMVYAVWHRDDSGIISYIAFDSNYDGELDLPFLFGDNTYMSTAMLGRDINNLAEAAEWAKKELAKDLISCAILLDFQGIVAAWELDQDGKPVLVARGIRPPPKQVTLIV